jgi:hypothetical protein
MMLIRSGYNVNYFDVVLHQTLAYFDTYAAAVQQGLKGVVQYQVCDSLLPFDHAIE